ncbi:hypothetical protein [Mailhella sp.]|uniref:hypothetical protein n=1 Tax=Mailhella sp. TaxID=1981029 RepID=UPI004064499E
MLTKGAIGNLINRYRAVLKKCNLINTFGSLAVASMLVMGSAGAAEAIIVSGAEHITEEELATEIAITEWGNGDIVTVTNENTVTKDYRDTPEEEKIAVDFEGKNIIFGGPIAFAEGTSVGDSISFKDQYAHVDETNINVIGNTKGDVVRVQLNAGGTAINPGAVSSVGKSNISISGPIELARYTQYEYDEAGNISNATGYTPIRGGGCSVNGGKTYVEESHITINAVKGMKIGVSDIMGGGCVVAGGRAEDGVAPENLGEAYTRNSKITITNLKNENLVPITENRDQQDVKTRIFGGGDMAEVRNAEINLINCSATELNVYGGGYAEEEGQTTITGNTKINIEGYSIEEADQWNDEVSQKAHAAWKEWKDVTTNGQYPDNGVDNRIWHFAGSIVGGGYSSTLNYDGKTMAGKTSVENAEINIKNSTMRSSIIGGGYAEYGGEAYVGTTNVTITDNSVIDCNGISNRGDVFGGGWAKAGTVHVDTVNLTITGGATVMGQVYGGGATRMDT